MQQEVEYTGYTLVSSVVVHGGYLQQEVEERDYRPQHELQQRARPSEHQEANEGQLARDLH